VTWPELYSRSTKLWATTGAGQNGPNGDARTNLVMDLGFTPTYSIGNGSSWMPTTPGPELPASAGCS